MKKLISSGYIETVKFNGIYLPVIKKIEKEPFYRGDGKIKIKTEKGGLIQKIV